MTLTDDWAMSQMVIDWMKANLRPDICVVELGGGTGSFRIHEHFENVVTVEHDRKWAKQLIKEGLPVLYCPLEGSYYRKDERLLKLIRMADVIIVDGPPADKRLGFYSYLKEVRNNAVLVFDDTHRGYMNNLLRHVTITTIRDGKRLTTIQRANNEDRPASSPMGNKAPTERGDKEAVPHTEMEAVSQAFLEHPTTVQNVRKKRKRVRPHNPNKHSS
tara:strand:+ start:2467 stop:3117 length:651 start_codon:yes stop_codon:yes gene_type:complete